MTGIYKITNLVTGDFYIGQSLDVERRAAEHKCPKGSHNPRLKKDISKYGVESFSFSVIEKCEPEMLRERELFYIRTLNPQYNTIGKPRSLETKNKLHEAGKIQWENLSDTEKERVIKHNLKGPPVGHTVSKETREKLRNANLGKRRLRTVVIVETGQEFPSVKECAEFLGVTQGTVRYNISGKTKFTKGYRIRHK